MQILKMPNSFDDLIKLSQQFERLEKCESLEKSGQYGGQISEKPKPSPPMRRRSILKNKAKSADAATLLRLKSTLTNDNSDDDDFINETAKNVKFADDSQLVQIRKYVPSAENMDLWASSNYFKDNTFNTGRPKTSFSLQTIQKPPELAICFKDPYLQPDFKEKVRSQKVALDRCGARERTVTGVVIVCNIEYHKEVFVRYTLDKWKTIQHTDAVYIPNSSDGETDRFMFTILVPKCCETMEFAVCYRVSQGEFWDSNGGKNYKVQDILYAAID